MLNEIQKVFGSLETAKREWYNELSKFSNEELNRRANAEQWSALQNVEHLIITEGLSVLYIRKKLQYADKAKKSGFMNGLRSKLLIALTKNRLFKYKAPKMLKEPTHPSEIEDTFERWTNVRQELAQELKKMDSKVLHKELFKHPIAGRMGIEPALKFMEAHVIRHQDQVRKSMSK